VIKFQQLTGYVLEYPVDFESMIALMRPEVAPDSTNPDKSPLCRRWVDQGRTTDPTCPDISGQKRDGDRFGGATVAICPGPPPSRRFAEKAARSRSSTTESISFAGVRKGANGRRDPLAGLRRLPRPAYRSDEARSRPVADPPAQAELVAPGGWM